MDDRCIAASPYWCRFRSIVNINHPNRTHMMPNLITRLFFDSLCLLIVLIQKIQKINSYQMHGFVIGSDTTKGEERSKMQRNLKKNSFSDPYEWAWSVIESLPLVAIETFDADLRSDHERWTMTTPLLSPHERIPSISVLAATNEGFEWERERETKLQLHKCFCTRVLFIEPLVWAAS